MIKYYERIKETGPFLAISALGTPTPIFKYGRGLVTSKLPGAFDVNTLRSALPVDFARTSLIAAYYLFVQFLVCTRDVMINLSHRNQTVVVVMIFRICIVRFRKLNLS